LSTATAAEWIARLGLERHPEGGWFRQTYRAAESIDAAALPARYGAARAFSTAIYFLLERGDVSALHRLRSDELWFHHAGGALRVHAIAEDGALTTAYLGPDPARGQTLQACVPHGQWFGAELDEGAAWALVGCTVSPGFDFADFELAERGAALARWPQHRALVARLTPSREESHR
jgi:predicted cupin superfamily sugar epimerase